MIKPAGRLHCGRCYQIGQSVEIKDGKKLYWTIVNGIKV